VPLIFPLVVSLDLSIVCACLCYKIYFPCISQSRAYERQFICFIFFISAGLVFKFMFVISSSNVLRISSSFLYNFSIFFLFFSKFLNFNSKNRRFLKSDPADPAEFWRFSEKSASFLNPTHHDPIFSSFLVFMHGKLIRSPCLFSSVSLRSRYYPGRFPVPRMSKRCSLILVSRPSLSP
jgi:hypothetical protein